MKNNFILRILEFGAVIVLFTSCATNKVFSGNGDLCGMIVDENNDPIQGFEVYCSSTQNTAITNENGIFVIPNIPAGEYFLSGKKSGYAKLDEIPFNFVSRDNLFCCKVNSLDYILESVEKQLNCKNYYTAMELLNDLYVNPKTQEEVSVLYYEAFTNLMAENKETAGKYIEKLLQNPYSKETEITKEMECMVNEM